MSSDRRLVLASASPARLTLLRQAGLQPEVVVSQVDESTVTAPRVAEQVALLAAAKAAAVAKQESDALVIGADSLLEFRGEAMGKPADAHEARDRWQRMGGHSGTLHTGQALLDVQDGAVVSRVTGRWRATTGSGTGMRGRTVMSSTVTAGMARVPVQLWEMVARATIPRSATPVNGDPVA